MSEDALPSQPQPNMRSLGNESIPRHRVMISWGLYSRSSSLGKMDWELSDRVFGRRLRPALVVLSS
jgi:hypothetical protein